MTSSRSTPPASPATMLDTLAKDLRDFAGRLLAMASHAEELARLFRGDKP